MVLDAAPDAGPHAPPFEAQRFETLFEQAPFSVQLLAPDGRTLRVNQAWRELWGIPLEVAHQVLVVDGYNLFDDPLLEAQGVTALLRRAFAGESVSIPPLLYDPRDLGRPGRARWVRAKAHPLRDGENRVREVMLIHEDVTERLESETELRAREQKLKQFANSIPQLAWIADAKGRIHWYNDRWHAYTGASLDECRDWGWQQFIHPDHLPAMLAAVRESLEKGVRFEMTYPLRAHDGSYRTFYVLAAPVCDAQGRIVEWFGTNTDVSGLEAAQAELRDAEEQLRLATAAGNIGIWTWDLAQNRVAWSERVYALHGLAPGSFGGTAEDFTRLVHPEDLPELWSRVEQAAAQGEGFSAEFRVLLPGGGERWLATWARVHRLQGGAVRMVGATLSIDAYKKAEAALRDSDQRKDDFLAMLAHELRNPLAPISTAAELLQSGAGDPRKTRQASEIIARQARHMAELLDDLLDVSRVTRGLIELNLETLDLHGVIGAAIEQVRPLIEARQHGLSTWTSAGPLVVRGDRTRLVQVLVNLLHNAAKYTPTGGRIEVRAESASGCARISVEDSGQGIEPDLLPYVFDLFTQAQRTPDRALGGLGVGLALVRSLVSLHGGHVQAHSDGPAAGSRFTITLPLSAHPLPKAEPPPAGRAAQTPLRIMVVDDNVDAALALASLLELDGHRVSVEHAALSALRAAQAARPPHEVFILDIGLPDLDGLALARRLRAEPATAQARLIALTGYGQPQDRAQTEAAGFDAHLVKPVDAATLAAALTAGRGPRGRP